MAGISIDKLVYTDRPLTWRSKPSCPRCTLSFTAKYGDVQREAYLLDCQHLLCGICVQECKLERYITCKICNHRTNIPEDVNNVTQALHPSLYVLGLVQQLEYETENVRDYWQKKKKPTDSVHTAERSSGNGKLSHSDFDKPEKLLSLLDKAYDAFEKSKKYLENEAEMQQKNVFSVVEQINAHFMAMHNALQIKENQLLQEVRSAYIDRLQRNRKDQCQLKMVKKRLYDYTKQAKLFYKESKKKTSGASYSSWKQFSMDVRRFLEKEPMMLEGDEKKMLCPPIRYEPRETFLSDVRAAHSLHVDVLPENAALVPITYTDGEGVDGSANTSKQPTTGQNTSKNERRASERSKGPSTSNHDRSPRQGAEGSDDGHVLRTVNVTHIVSPREFYVQDELFQKKGAKPLSELCTADAQAYDPLLITGSEPFTITPGKLYLVRGEGFEDLAWNNRWYRAEIMAVNAPSRGQYQVQYVDYGMYDTVVQDQIRPLSEELAVILPKAVRCALYELQPAHGAQQWTDEAHQVMKDFCGGRSMLMWKQRACDDGVRLVDLFLPPVTLPGEERRSTDPYKQWAGHYGPMSLRTALIYLNVARPRSELSHQVTDARRFIMRQCKWHKLRWLKDALAGSLRRARLPCAPVLQEHDHFDCIITHAKSIEHFYIMPTKWRTTMLEPLQRHLDTVCRTADRVYCPYEGLVCAFASPDKDGAVVWLRGRVVKLLQARCLLFALDTGGMHETPWTDMRLLPPDDPALHTHPLAARCSLGYIRPRRVQAGTFWSHAANNEFLQIVCSRALRFTVSIGQFDSVCRGGVYSVLLYLVNKSDRDTCLNGLLVQNEHAECIGLEENVQDRIRQLAPGEQEPPEPKPSTSTTGRKAVGPVADPRMSVVMLRIVSPGEFYVLLCEQQGAFEQMHKLLQEHMDDRIDEEEEDEEEEEEKEKEKEKEEEEKDKEGAERGEVEAAERNENGADGVAKSGRKKQAPGDVCVVFARVKEGDPCEWHRARIETVIDGGEYYGAFLIDRAVTTKVHRTNVARLTARMAQIQPVAFRCRLACLAPVGGSPSWHQSTHDAFRNLIAGYTQHAISLDAKPKPNAPDQALPVVLWGVRVEDREALAPCRTVYHNLNQALARAGLAHLSGRFRTFATSGSGATVEHQLLEDAIGAQLRSEMEQFFRTVAAVRIEGQASGREGEGGADREERSGEAGEAVRDGSKTAENVLNEREHECMKVECLAELAQVGSAEGGNPVHAWPPAVRLEKSIFVGVPTHVGSDGTVYLHDIVQEPLLERIRTTIQAHVATIQDGCAGTRFYAGRACLARFHLDGQYYRAAVTQELGDDRYMVRFVDYGNVEASTSADMLPASVCGTVPVQAVKVRLSGVVPKAKNERPAYRGRQMQRKWSSTAHTTVSHNWPEDALDACHSLIVQKRCSVRIDAAAKATTGSGRSTDAPSAPYCRLRLLETADGASVELADVLLKLGLFKAAGTDRPTVGRAYSESLFDSSVPEEEPRADAHQREMLDELLQRPSSRASLHAIPVSPADRDLKQWIENIGTAFEAERTLDGSKEFEDPNEYNYNNDTLDPFNKAQLIDALEPDSDEPVAGTSETGERTRFRVVTVEFDDSSSMPSPATLNSEEFETSSRLSEPANRESVLGDGEHGVDGAWRLAEPERLEDGRLVSPLFRAFPVLPPLQPARSSPAGFFADFTNCARELTLYVHPHLEGHTFRMNALAKRVQECARSNNALYHWQATLTEPGAPCLAPYWEDGLYYRAIVESRHDQQRTASVLFVDFLNRETVPLSELRKCPFELQRVALRNLPVRLAGVRTNPRLHEPDVARRLSELLVNPFFVKLDSAARPTTTAVLPVKLYTDPDCHTLVYQQMIDDKYFVRTPERI